MIKWRMDPPRRMENGNREAAPKVIWRPYSTVINRSLAKIAAGEITVSSSGIFSP